MIRALGSLFAGLLGLAFGSFLNVCLSRWPEGESVSVPRSHCRACGRTLAWWENVPLLSWLVLQGQCRTCNTWIGLRYPLVELAVGVLWADAAWQFLAAGTPPAFFQLPPYTVIISVLGHMILFWLLVALAVLDAEHLWLPDWLTMPGIGAGLVFSVLTPQSRIQGLTRIGAFGEIPGKVAGILLAIIAAAGLILLIRWMYWLIRRQEGIGLGDAKLMALLAAWLGLPGALLSFGIGVVLGALLALGMLASAAARREKERWGLTRLPLGTYLCIGGMVSCLWGDRIIAAYLKLAGF